MIGRTEIIQWGIETALSSWMLLVWLLSRRLALSYPPGRTYEHAQRRTLQQLLICFASLLLFTLLQFSIWASSWHAAFSTTQINSWLDAESSTLVQTTLPLLSLILGSVAMTVMLIRERQRRVHYLRRFGLDDLLIQESLTQFAKLSEAKQTSLAERLCWLIEDASQAESVSTKLALCFDPSEFDLLAELLTPHANRYPTSVIALIYRELQKQRASCIQRESP
ncbi:MAG: hypothetical protein AB1489_01685 [Acidobacteriota bacterium]